jgi:hypothetical protein
MPAKYFAIIFPLYFLTLWIGISYLIAKMGGWRALAARFRTSGEFSGATWSFQGAAMRLGTRYNGCLTVGANNQGLFIRPFVFFRAWHPPLFVPWTEITVVPQQRWYGNMVNYTLGRGEKIPFMVREKLAQRIQEAARQQWNAAPIG